MKKNDFNLKITRAIYVFMVPANYLLSHGKSILFSIAGIKRDRYGIKTQYIPRMRYIHLDTRASTDEFQDEVYENAKRFFDERNLSSVLDFGCGSGYKLLKYFSEYDTVGAELSPAYEYLQEQYPERKWIRSDFSMPPEGHFDLVICIDVIEHLKNPDDLLGFFLKLDFDYLLISTPDRERLGFLASFGPPNNLHHIREWGKQEFVDYVSGYLKVITSEVVSHHEHYLIAEKVRNALE